MRSKLVCLCNLVTEGEIILAIKKGAVTIGDIQNITRAGTTCGKCHQDVNRLVEDNHEESGKRPQLKLDF